MKSAIVPFIAIIGFAGMCFLAGLFLQQHLTEKELSHYPIHIIDTETVSTAERKPLIND